MSLTTGSLWSSIWQISWPMLLIMIFNFLVGFVDVYVAGFISPEVQAAVGFVSLLYFTVIILANAISIGTVALVSRAAGAGDFGRAVEVARQSLLLGGAVAVALSLAGFFFAREIVAAAGFPEEIREIARVFLRIFSLALGADYMLIISNAVFRAGGDVRAALLTMLSVSAVNIIGDFVLVFGIPGVPGLGYPGIAFATAFSAALGMGISFVLFLRSRWRPLYRGSWAMRPAAIRQIVGLGWPAAMLQIAWNGGTIVLYNILGRLGEDSIVALAAIANGLRIEGAIFLPAFALNMSASVLIGQNLGAGDPERAERVGWRIAGAGALILSAMAVVVFIWAEFFAGLVAKDPAVLAETARYLRLNMLGQPFIALSLSLSGGLQGAGDTRGPMWAIVIAMWLIRLPLAYGLALHFGFGAVGVWWSMVISMACQGLLMARRFSSGRWKELQLE
ncbi:MAG: Multidrug resistance protein MdtK [Syntrophaceae bacterium PtaU1.Bin231]|nr:MAG: Multidrug resistance protein MdtK [Syntrophaceae bacterium PtaU1.Bin231]HOG16434.1 MATE family efflux transporter [Syntrophales bacterium]